jgi:hypothetical protein
VRLGTCILMGAALAAAGLRAEERQPLPWERLLPLGWQAGPRSAESPVPFVSEPSDGPLVASLSGDGTLRISDVRGSIRLQVGLPGRPLQAWRDGGLPLSMPSGHWTFPTDTPLSKGLGGLQWCSEDFRPFLRGLLWIMDDGEAFLTVVHPATGRVIHLPLPPGQDLQLSFLPDRLEVAAARVDKGAPRLWSIPWMGLLPRLAALGPRPDPPKAGTALNPFPKD